jgi:hypothetical protein
MKKQKKLQSKTKKNEDTGKKNALNSINKMKKKK